MTAPPPFDRQAAAFAVDPDDDAAVAALEHDTATLLDRSTFAPGGADATLGSPEDYDATGWDAGRHDETLDEANRALRQRIADDTAPDQDTHAVDYTEVDLNPPVPDDDTEPTVIEP